MPRVNPSRSRSAGLSRDFQLLMAGSFISMLGTRISTIACPLLALYLTGSPFDAGLVAFAATVPSVLVYIPAGALVDRWDPRLTMLICESGRGVAIAFVAVILKIGRPSAFLLIPIVFIEEVLEVFSTLADRRCVRDLVPRDRASSAQASIEARAHVVVLVGRPLGVFLFGIAPILPFLADTLSFIVSVSSIATLRLKHAVAVSGSRASKHRLGNEISTAWKWLLSDKYASTGLALSGGTSVIGQALIMVFLAEAHASGRSSVWVGLVLAASGVGGVLGSLSAPLMRMPSKASLVLLQMLVWVGALAFLAVWGWRSFLCMAIVMAILSLTGALGNIEIDTYLVQRVDENMLARIFSFERLVAFSACAVGPMLGGVLIQFSGVRNAMSELAVIMFILAVLTWFTPTMRDPGEVVLAISEVGRSARRVPNGLRRLGYVTAVVVAAVALVSAVGASLPTTSSASMQLPPAQSSLTAAEVSALPAPSMPSGSSATAYPLPVDGQPMDDQPAVTARGQASCPNRKHFADGTVACSRSSAHRARVRGSRPASASPGAAHLGTIRSLFVDAGKQIVFVYSAGRQLEVRRRPDLPPILYQAPAGCEYQALTSVGIGLYGLVRCGVERNVVVISTSTFQVTKTLARLNSCLGNQTLGVVSSRGAAITVDTSSACLLPAAHGHYFALTILSAKDPSWLSNSASPGNLDLSKIVHELYK